MAPCPLPGPYPQSSPSSGGTSMDSIPTPTGPTMGACHKLDLPIQSGVFARWSKFFAGGVRSLTATHTSAMGRIRDPLPMGVECQARRSGALHNYRTVRSVRCCLSTGLESSPRFSDAYCRGDCHPRLRPFGSATEDLPKLLATSTMRRPSVVPPHQRSRHTEVFHASSRVQKALVGPDKVRQPGAEMARPWLDKQPPAFLPYLRLHAEPKAS